MPETGNELLKRISRIEGQVRGISRMIEEARPCEDVLIQLLAVRTALDRVTSEVVGSRIDECLASQEAGQYRRSIQRMVELLLRAS